MNLPDGPKALPELFQWPRYNARKLLLESPESNTLRSNFQNLLKYDIEIHDNYSGTGTGSVTLHLQHKHMMSAFLRSLHQQEAATSGKPKHINIDRTPT